MTSPLDGLPAAYPVDLMPEIEAAIAASGRKLIALDDDPTGVQTVHSVPVLARWETADLAAELREPESVAFVLTNSRSVPEADARTLNLEIATNLLDGSRETGVGVAVASRSDSTLRGHFPAETDALAAVLGPIDGILLVPAFFDGGRVTVGGEHYVREGEGFVPAAETEFARDATFGYRSSNLPAWVEEKTGGRVPAAAVASVGLDDIRRGGPDRVEHLLAGLTGGTVAAIDAVVDRDLEVVALAALRAEGAGKRFLYRTGASFVRARAGIRPRPLLTREELVGAGAPGWLPGVVVVGSHVRRSGEQLAHLLGVPGTAAIELSVPQVVAAATREGVIADARDEVVRVLAAGGTPVLFTSREVIAVGDAAAQLELSRAVSSALVEVVAGIGRGEVRPSWVVGKGGITSSDIGTRALGARRAIVLGQVAPGVPVWRLGPEARYPGLPYVVFPGNVGGPETLAEVVRLLLGENDENAAAMASTSRR